MTERADHIVELLQRHLRGELPPAEQRSLAHWLADNPALQEFVNGLAGGEGVPGLLRTVYHADHSGIATRIEQAFPGLSLRLPDENIKSSRGITFFLSKAGWFKYAAAIIILFGIGAYLWNNNESHPETNTATIKPSSSDIQPGGQRATLTLADGRQIILDSATNGQLAIESGSEIIKRDGQVIYGSPPIPSNGGVAPGSANSNLNSSSPGAGVGYNTMATPRGGQYQLTLNDGTKVWLNAASSITYPIVFTGKVREVKTEGEVYFEVKQNKSMPFVVKSGSDKIVVLGTAFNINNYRDEPAGKISLIDGAIKVNDRLLQPGQAFVDGKIIRTDVQQDIAWKNGFFNFNGLEFSEVMRMLERWYDIEVKYQGKIPTAELRGKMQRELSLQEVLDVLREMHVKFDIHGRTLLIK